MSFILKTLEKLLDRHIRDEILVNRPLHQDQYAYRAGMSTETALHQLVGKAEYVLTHKEVLLCAFLDIEGAFDNTSLESILKASRKKGIDETSCRWIDCMLRERLVYTSILGETLVARVGRGCPQGGVLSPLLWNLVMDELLRLLDKDGHKTIGYADDLVILAQGKFNNTVRESMQKALNVVSKWTDEEGLNISPTKSNIIAFTRRRNLEGLGPLKLRDEQIQLSGEVKYLGVILDSRLTWNQHIDRIKKRAETTLMLARRAHGKTWGLRPSMMYWTYTTVVRPMITYASLVWWTKMQQRTASNKLSRVQRLACLGIMGAIRTTPTSAMEVLLDLPPLQFVIMGEARMAFLRLQNLPSGRYVELGHNQIKNQVGDNILDMRMDYMVPKFGFNMNFEVEITDRREWNNAGIRDQFGRNTWYTDGSRTEQGTGAGIYSDMPNSEYSISLGKYTSVFQAEIYAILQCAKENNMRAYKKRQINILTDSQASLKALTNPKVTSKLVWECREELRVLADHNKVTLLWVPGHSGIEGNEKADELARKGSSAPYIGPEPALGVTKTTARGQIRKWVKDQHNEYWEQITRLQHGKTFIKEPSRKKAEELLRLSRNQLRIVVGLLTGHCALKGHLHRIGLYNGDLKCRQCDRGTETAYHILCECEALDHRRQNLYGQPKMLPEEYGTRPVMDLYKLVQGTRLLEWVL